MNPVPRTDVAPRASRLPHLWLFRERNLPPKMLGRYTEASQVNFYILQGSPRYCFFLTAPDRTVLQNDGTIQSVDGISISHGTTFDGKQYRRI